MCEVMSLNQANIFLAARANVFKSLSYRGVGTKRDMGIPAK